MPGVTAAVAVAAYAGIPLTQRDHASAVALVTGREDDAKETDLDFDALARFPGTLVFYMGVTTAAAWSATAHRRRQTGRHARRDRAALLVAGPNDESFAVLDEVAGANRGRAHSSARAGRRGRRLRGGGDARLVHASAAVWRSACSVTRPEQQADDLSRRLMELGAEVLIQPAITIGDPPDWRPVDEAIGRLRDVRLAGFFERQRRDVFLRSRLRVGARHAALGRRAAGGDRDRNGRAPG